MTLIRQLWRKKPLNYWGLPWLSSYSYSSFTPLMASTMPLVSHLRPRFSPSQNSGVLLHLIRLRLLDFVASLDEELVKSASQKAFLWLPDDLSKAVSELTVLKGVGPATASAVLAAYAPEVAPFMSDEAMEVVLGHSKDYSLKQYLLLANRLAEKAKELSSEDEQFTASDVERALWSSAIEAKLSASSAKQTQVTSKKSCGRKRKKSS